MMEGLVCGPCLGKLRKINQQKIMLQKIPAHYQMRFFEMLPTAVSDILQLSMFIDILIFNSCIVDGQSSCSTRLGLQQYRVLETEIGVLKKCPLNTCSPKTIRSLLDHKEQMIIIGILTSSIRRLHVLKYAIVLISCNLTHFVAFYNKWYVSID